jgi:hypothetical protein
MLSAKRMVVVAFVSALAACDAADPPSAAIEPAPQAAPAVVDQGTAAWTSPSGKYSLLLPGWTVSSTSPLEADSRGADGRLRMCSGEEAAFPATMSQAEADRRTAAMTASNIASAVSGATDVTVEHREINGVTVADMRYQQAGFRQRRLMFALVDAAGLHSIFVTCGVSLPAASEDIAAIDAVLNSLTLHAE